MERPNKLAVLSKSDLTVDNASETMRVMIERMGELNRYIDFLIEPNGSLEDQARSLQARVNEQSDSLNAWRQQHDEKVFEIRCLKDSNKRLQASCMSHDSRIEELRGELRRSKQDVSNLISSRDEARWSLDEAHKDLVKLRSEAMEVVIHRNQILDENKRMLADLKLLRGAIGEAYAASLGVNPAEYSSHAKEDEKMASEARDARDAADAAAYCFGISFAPEANKCDCLVCRGAR